MQELGKIIETSLNEKIIYEDSKILLNELTNKKSYKHVYQQVHINFW